MIDQLLLFEATTSDLTGRAISSPASAGGPSRCGSPGGPMTGRSGPVPAPANLSASPDAGAAHQTSVTFGLFGENSSPSADLEICLVNRLKTRLRTTGSMLFVLTWSTLDTPLRRSVCALRASARHTFGSACTLSRATWPTPQSRDWKGAPEPGNDLTHNARPLNEVARLASWGTPNCPSRHDSENTAGRWYATKRKGHLDHHAAMTGTMSSGSPAATGSCGQLNPAHSRWLQGFPSAWDDCAPTVTRSCRNSPPRSSALISTS